MRAYAAADPARGARQHLVSRTDWARLAPAVAKPVEDAERALERTIWYAKNVHPLLSAWKKEKEKEKEEQEAAAKAAVAAEEKPIPPKPAVQRSRAVYESSVEVDVRLNLRQSRLPAIGTDALGYSIASPNRPATAPVLPSGARRSLSADLNAARSLAHLLTSELRGEEAALMASELASSRELRGDVKTYAIDGRLVVSATQQPAESSPGRSSPTGRMRASASAPAWRRSAQPPSIRAQLGSREASAAAAAHAGRRGGATDAVEAMGEAAASAFASAANHDAQLTLREAIQSVMRRHKAMRPTHGQSLVGLLRKVRAFDIHLGNLVDRVLTSSLHLGRSSNSLDGMAEEAEEPARALRPRCWPQIKLKLQMTDAAAAAAAASAAATPQPDRAVAAAAAVARGKALAARELADATSDEDGEAETDREFDAEAAEDERPTTAPESPPLPSAPQPRRSGSASSPSSRRRSSPPPRRVLIARGLHALAEADRYSPLQLDAQAGHRREAECEAASRFDERRSRYAGRTHRALATLHVEPESLPAVPAFDESVSELFRNRYVAPPDVWPNVVVPPSQKKPRRRKRGWRLEESIWAPRLQTSNTKDFYETERAGSTLLRNDWHVARLHHQLAYFIRRTQLEPAQLSQLGGRAAVEHAHAPEVEAVYEALQRHVAVVHGAFFHYATVGKSFKGKDRVDQTEIHYVKLNPFYEFVSDCGLTSPSCDLDSISVTWSIIDAKDKATTPLDPHNVPGALCRHEWLQMIVRLAVLTQIQAVTPGNEQQRGDVASAVDAFCTRLSETLPPVALLQTDQFRSRFCYQEPTDRVLRHYEPLLRCLFAGYASLGNHGLNDASKLASTSMMSIGEWLEMLTNLGLVRLGLVSVHTAMQAFSLARIRCCQDSSNAQEMRLRNLLFEDFLEALVRLAHLLALPTLEMVREAAAADAADFLLALHADAPSHFRQFVAHRSGSWLGQPRQRIHRCLDMLLSLMAQLIEANAAPRAAPKKDAKKDAAQTGMPPAVATPAPVTLASTTSAAAANDEAASAVVQPPTTEVVTAGVISKVTMSAFIRHRVRSCCRLELGPHASPTRRHTDPALSDGLQSAPCHRPRQVGGASDLVIPTPSFDGSRIASVLLEIEAHNTRILTGVPAFSGLQPRQIAVLLKEMSVAKFQRDEYVFEQGDLGDTFYLITCGHAIATRIDPVDDQQEEQTIARLSASDCFGELALVRNEPRAATIVVTSATLDTLFITRAAFEAKLGPLKAFQLARYEGVVHSEGIDAAPPSLVKDPSVVRRREVV